MADVVPTVTDEERGRQILVAWKQDLQKLALQGEYGQHGNLVIIGTAQVLTALMRRAVRLAPEYVPVVRAVIADMDAQVLQIAQPDDDAADVGPTH